MKHNRILLVVVLSLMLLLAVSVGSSSASSSPATTFTLGMGASRYFPAANVTIKFLAVTEDTRCALCWRPAPGYVAIQVGVSYANDINPAVIDFRLVEGSPAPVVRLANGYRLTLLEVLPYPDGSATVARRVYEAKFRLDGPEPSPDGAGLVAGASAAGRSPDAPATFTLALGETRYIPAGDLTIHFLSVTEDTRCDAAVPCPRIGAVEIVLLVWYSDFVGPEKVKMILEGDAENTSTTLSNGFQLTLHEVLRLGFGDSDTPDPGWNYEATFSLHAPAPAPAPAAEAGMNVFQSRMTAD